MHKCSIDKDDPGQGVLKTTDSVHVRVSSVQCQAAAQAWAAGVSCVSWPGWDQLGLILSWQCRGQWPSPVRECVHWPRPASDRGQRPSAQELSLRSCCSAPSSALQVSCDQGPSPDTPLTVLTVLRLLVTSLTSDTSDMPMGAQWHPGHVGPGLVTPTIIQMTTWYELSVGPRLNSSNYQSGGGWEGATTYLRVRVKWFLWGLVGVAHLNL